MAALIKMNSVWDSVTKSWTLQYEGSPTKYKLKLSWSDGIAALHDGGEIKECITEMCGGILRQKKLVIPRPQKRFGEYSVRTFALVEL